MAVLGTLLFVATASLVSTALLRSRKTRAQQRQTVRIDKR